MQAAKRWLASLSFRTGLVVGAVAIVCYIISFAQILLPVSAAAKGVLWIVFFGLAKTAQYTALLIIGKAGVGRIKMWLRRHRQP